MPRKPKALHQAERARHLADVLERCAPGAPDDLEQLADLPEAGRCMAAELAHLGDPPSATTWAAAVAIILDRRERPRAVVLEAEYYPAVEYYPGGDAELLSTIAAAERARRALGGAVEEAAR